MLQVQNIKVDPVGRQVWVDAMPVRLTRMEFDLLYALISQAGDIVSRRELMRRVWHEPQLDTSKTIDVHLGWLRRKLGDDPRHPHLITTVRGIGLRFEREPPE